jgi:DNA-binding NarL/FixJ family response regulator
MVCAMPVHEGHGPPRLLLGNLEPMVELGMTAVLEEEGVDVLGAEPRPAALVLMASSLQPDAPVMVCSSDLKEESVLSAMHAGAIGYLRKDTLTTETLAARCAPPPTGRA